jgi:hypothetical protein
MRGAGAIRTRGVGERDLRDEDEQQGGEEAAAGADRPHREVAAEEAAVWLATAPPRREHHAEHGRRERPADRLGRVRERRRDAGLPAWGGGRRGRRQCPDERAAAEPGDRGSAAPATVPVERQEQG